MSMARLLAEKTLGASPKRIDRELRKFTDAANVPSHDQPRLIHKYPKKWVAIFSAKVEAADSTFDGLPRKLRRRKIDPSKTLIRFIDTSDRKLIL